jgi:uncharacterized Fe-S cluster protein YjdI/CDGSH-type Zn-finger protein
MSDASPTDSRRPDAPAADPAAPDAAPHPSAAPAAPPAHGAPVRRDYARPGIVVHWAAERCIHTGRCIAAQPAVFDPTRRPWVDVSRADPDAIARAVERCPTGALGYTRTDGGAPEARPEALTIRVGRDGPLLLHGPARVVGERVGPLDPDRTATGRFALCRCGRTGHAPFCDNSHRALGAGWGAAGAGNAGGVGEAGGATPAPAGPAG